MISPRAITGDDYGDTHLENDDYYDENRQVQGRYYGEGTKILGLDGAVKSEDFRSLMRGEDPQTGKSLRMLGGGNKQNSDGEYVGKRCAGIDATMNAPKGWSIAAMRDPRCAAAYDRAVGRTIAQMESRMTIRDMAGGGLTVRQAMPVIVRYDHTASRALDPQAHSHVIFLNLAYDPSAKKWRTLNTKTIYQHRAFFSEIFRAELAREAAALGYEIETNRDKRGKYIGWEIKGVPEELRDKFSERSRQRDAGIAAELARRQQILKQFPGGNDAKLESWLKTQGEMWADLTAQKLSGVEVNKVVRDTRAPKLRHISQEEVRALQEAKLTPEDKRLLERVVDGAKRRSDDSLRGCETLAKHDGRRVTAAAAAKWAVAHVMERKAVARDTDILAAAMEHFPGLDCEAATRALIAMSDEKSILMGERGTTGEIPITTPEMIAREAEILAIAKSGIGKHGRLGPENFLPPLTAEEKTDKITGASNIDQRRVVEAMLNSRDGVTLLSGAAGVGKSHCARNIADAIESTGTKVWALAPTAAAVEELRRNNFTTAQTIALALAKSSDTRQGAQPGDVLMVDEAAMVGTKDMLALLEHARERGARVILMGDRNQLQAVSAGSAWALLEDSTRCARFSLLEVRRQTNRAYRDAVKTLRQNPEAGLEQLASMGAIVQCPQSEQTAEMVKEYFAEAEKLRSNGQKQDVMVLARTHTRIDEITEAIRAERIRRGEIDPVREVSRVTHQSLQWTEAEKRLAEKFDATFVIRFHAEIGEGFPRHSKAEVMGMDENGGVRIRNTATGAEMTVAPGVVPTVFSEGCDVMCKRSVRIAAGEKIQFLVNRNLGNQGGKRRKCTNGEIATVESVNTATGEITLKDGRVLGEGFEDWSLAYCSTIHKAQGATADKVLIAADGLTRELFYVAATRGKTGLKVFTSDENSLAHTITVSEERGTATAFANEYFAALMRRKSAEQQREAIEQSRRTSPAPEKHADPPIEGLPGRGSRPRDDTGRKTIGGY